MATGPIERWQRMEIILAVQLMVAVIAVVLAVSAKEKMMSNFDELNAKLDAIQAVVQNVAADVADLIALLNNAGNIPQEIMDKVDSIKASLDGIDAEH